MNTTRTPIRPVRLLLCAAPLITLTAIARQAAPSEPWCTVGTVGEVAPADLALIRNAIRQGTTLLDRYFDDPRLTEILHNADIAVRLHAQPAPQANEVTATAHTRTTDGTVATYIAEIHLLAASAHPSGAMTSAGEPKDATYFPRLAVHELSTVPLDLTTRARPGWRFHSAPTWFVQGYEEYLGMTCSPGPEGRTALRRRTAMLAADAEQVDDAFGLDVRDPYIAGAVLLHFMHERYGADAVKGILRSEERTFGRAVRAALGVDLPTFMEHWRAWLKEQA